MGKETWNLTEEQREKFKPIVEEYINKLEKTYDDIDSLDLTFEGISVIQLKELLEELEYKEDTEGLDTNGWEHDYWWYLENNNRTGKARRICMFGCAMTFDLRLNTGVK